MNYTKGEWKVRHPVNNDYTIYTGEYGKGIIRVAQLFESDPNAEANAHLIVAAVNACIKVNPDNPMAVAESIKDMYEALKAILTEPNLGLPGKLYVLANKALAKAEGR